MKKLNLNEAGAKVIAWGAILGIPVPAILLFVSRVCGGRTHSVLIRAAWFSMAAGAAAITILLALVTIELRQDAGLLRRYEAEKSIKHRLASGSRECQYCGSRMNGRDGRRCHVCGR